MIAQAKGKYIRVSPTKVRTVIDLIRGRDVRSSQMVLRQIQKGCKTHIAKVLNSALQNAKQKGLNEDQLYISRITADLGPAWQRYRAASFGRATGIKKKTTHLTIELDLKTK